MAGKKPNPKTYNDTAYVNAYMTTFEHPFKAEVKAIRSVILGT